MQLLDPVQMELGTAVVCPESTKLRTDETYQAEVNCARDNKNFSRELTIVNDHSHRGI